MNRRVLLRGGQIALVLVVTVVLPLTVHSVPLYLAAAAPCVLAAGALGYWDASRRRR